MPLAIFCPSTAFTPTPILARSTIPPCVRPGRPLVRKGALISSSSRRSLSDHHRNGSQSTRHLLRLLRAVNSSRRSPFIFFVRHHRALWAEWTRPTSSTRLGGLPSSPAALPQGISTCESARTLPPIRSRLHRRPSTETSERACRSLEIRTRII